MNEHNIRRQAYWTVAPHWNGKMPLTQYWQLWHIPEIDGEIKDMNIFSNIRKASDEEKERFEKILNGG